MDIKKITKSLIDISTPSMLKGWLQALMNKVEELEQRHKKDQEQLARVEAENRRLKGLPAKPNFSQDKTSELDKGDSKKADPKKGKKTNPAKGKPRRKKKDLKIDTTVKLEVHPDEIDGTYDYKGTRRVVVQDIVFKRNNIAFDLEKFYSSAHGKTVEADLPAGYDGGYFGPHLISYILCSYYEGDVTIKKIYRILKSIDIKISLKQINRIINNRPDNLQDEMNQAREAAIEKNGHQQIDDTSANILEEDAAYTIVTCNPSFTNLVTTPSKSRFEAVLALAGGNKSPRFKLNQQAILVAFVSLKSLKIQLMLEKWKSNQVYTEEEVDDFFKHEDFKKLRPLVLRDIKTAMLVGAFYDGHLGTTGEALVSDDAPQFNNLYDNHVLCWYHELRHYKELAPVLKEHRDKLLEFFTEVKLLYKTLKLWVKTRRPDLREYVFRWFNELFQKKTGYKLLDDRKRKSLGKMEKLLAPLWIKIRVPLENNEAERDLRGKVIKRKISLFDRTWEGAYARDLYLSLKQTCRKNNVSFYKFLKDRITKAGELPQLAEIIQISSPQY